MSQNKTLRESFDDFLKENEAGWCDENADGDKFYDPDFDAVADFFISKMRERIEGMKKEQIAEVNLHTVKGTFDSLAYNKALSDLLDYLK